MAEIELSRLLQRCAAGDELAWEALVRRFQARIYGIAYHYVADAEDARELAQEVFVRIYQNLPADLEPQRFVPWVVRIARNLCIDYLRRKKVRPHGSAVGLDNLNKLPTRDGNPEQQYFADSRKHLVYRALQELTHLSREIILLKEIQGLRLEEISSMLRIPVGTVKSRANRARLELAQKVLALSGSCPEGPIT